jgi:hypothetical protein
VYLVNYLSLQTAQQLFIAVSRFRTEQALIGPMNGANTTFTTPSGDKFVHNLPFLTIAVFYNGVRLVLLDDYMLAESGGPGTGFDTVLLVLAPVAPDHLIADYVLR